MFLFCHCSLLLLALLLNIKATHQTGVCKSIEITDVKHFKSLRNCSIVVGYVRIVNLNLSPTLPFEPTLVEEITDYLVIHRVQGLLTLQGIFPHLKLIRGQELLFDRYSLVVFENRDLENLGLISLLRIQSGNIRIENNPVLCYVDTVNWVYMLGNITRQHISFKNKPSFQCPLCNETSTDINESESLRNHCWSFDVYQSNPIFGRLENCPPDCGVKGCNDNGKCCSRRCLTGCSDINCELCGTLKQGRRCVDMCGFTFFELNKRECLKETDCLSKGLIPHAGACLEKCPMHYKKLVVGDKPRCTLPCSGSYEIRRSGDLSGLHDCTIIQGSLIIELDTIKEKIVQVLENALANIQEITGHLKIKNSPQLVSLQFLKSIHTIRGDDLIDEKYALYVVNNHYLEHIWNRGQNVSILKGTVYFHLNPRLCIDLIMKLESSIKENPMITDVDASPNSNGERVICGSSVRVLNATVEDFNATAALIYVNPMSADEKDVLVGYAHYYKEAPIRNVTRYDGRHGCGHDNWLMDISAGRNIRHIIANLKPYTQYAYFVKTLTMTDYHTQIDAYSEIQYFRTLPTKPGSPAKVYYSSLSMSKIMIHWWPPRIPNAEITTYVVSYEKIMDNSNTIATTNYLFSSMEPPTKDICQCQLKDPFYSGPPPDDENFYNKEQLVYDEALPNLIYFSRPNSKPKDNNTAEESNNQTEATTSTHYETEYIGVGSSSNAIENSSDQIDTTSSTEDPALIGFKRYREELERKSLAQQDTGRKNFPIIKSHICSLENASTQYQLKNGCRTIEKFEGIRVPGHIHHYVLENLDPESKYHISVRACRDYNECSRKTSVSARTISKTLEDFFKGDSTLDNDIEE